MIHRHFAFIDVVLGLTYVIYFETDLTANKSKIFLNNNRDKSYRIFDISLKKTFPTGLWEISDPIWM